MHIHVIIQFARYLATVKFEQFIKTHLQIISDTWTQWISSVYVTGIIHLDVNTIAAGPDTLSTSGLITARMEYLYPLLTVKELEQRWNKKIALKNLIGKCHDSRKL